MEETKEKEMDRLKEVCGERGVMLIVTEELKDDYIKYKSLFAEWFY